MNLQDSLILCLFNKIIGIDLPPVACEYINHGFLAELTVLEMLFLCGMSLKSDSNSKATVYYCNISRYYCTHGHILSYWSLFWFIVVTAGWNN